MKLAQVIGPTRENVAVTEPNLGIASQAHALGCSREDEIAWVEGHNHREIADELRNREYEIPRVAALHLFAVDRASK